MFSGRPENKFKWTRSSRQRNLQTYRYEPIQPYIFRDFVREFQPQYFLDVGASIGYYTLLIAVERICGQVTAYEPMPRTYNELERNVQLNGLEQIVTCRQVAASFRTGISKMNVVGELSGGNAIASTALHDSKILRSQMVKTCSLDELHQLSETKIAMKVDVEGHELEVIKGATELLEKNLTILQIEVFDSSDHSASVRSLLSELGYSQILSVGPDKYFTNDKRIPEIAIDIIEKSMTAFVEDFKKPLYLKSVFLPGIGLELSPRLLKFVPAILRPAYRRNKSR